LYDFVREKLNMPVEREMIARATPIGAGGLELESLSIVELSILAEGRFQTVVPDEDLDRVSRMNVSELTDYLNARLVKA
jgi:acyl carrier protein